MTTNDKLHTKKYFDDLVVNTQFELLGDNYLEQLRATLNYSPIPLSLPSIQLQETVIPITNVPVFDDTLGKVAISNTISEIDYLVLKYFWEDTAGSDLDTRTYIANPDRKRNMVGWSKANSDGNYLQWSGDNTGSGYEQILCNIDACKELVADNSNKEITIHMRAFWYSVRRSGHINVECTGYKGGTMSQNGFEWINTGGTKTQQFTIATQVNSQTRNDGELLAYIHYNTQTKTGRMVHVQQQNQQEIENAR